MKMNQAGLKLLKTWEGLRLKAYKDIIGVTTIGYGHVDPTLKLDDVITQEQADSYLVSDLDKFEQGIANAVKVPLTSNQFSALVSLVYNVGLGNLLGKGLLNKLNAKDYKGASDSFPLYDKAGGKTDAGLHKRRLAEQALFNTADPIENDLDSVTKTLETL